MQDRPMSLTLRALRQLNGDAAGVAHTNGFIRANSESGTTRQTHADDTGDTGAWRARAVAALPQDVLDALPLIACVEPPVVSVFARSGPKSAAGVEMVSRPPLSRRFMAIEATATAFGEGICHSVQTSDMAVTKPVSCNCKSEAVSTGAAEGSMPIAQAAEVNGQPEFGGGRAGSNGLPIERQYLRLVESLRSVAESNRAKSIYLAVVEEGPLQTDRSLFRRRTSSRSADHNWLLPLTVAMGAAPGCRWLVADLLATQPVMRGFGLRPRGTLAEIVAGTGRVEDGVVSTPLSNVDLLPGGNLAAPPDRVRLETLCRALQRSYDLVVVAGSVRETSWRAELAKCCDATVLVSKSDSATAAALEAKRLLQTDGAHLAGCVVIDSGTD